MHTLLANRIQSSMEGLILSVASIMRTESISSKLGSEFSALQLERFLESSAAGE
jgi:hypothetical protein